MELITLSLARKYDEINNLAITIGQFDGLHLAHIKIIKKTVKYARDRKIKSALFTFDPHPDYFLNKRVYNGYLTPNNPKFEKISSLGIDYLIIIPFSEKIATMAPKEFIDKILRKFRIQRIFIGYDFSFGHRGEGNSELLKEYYSVDITKEIDYKDEKICSTNIRMYLKDGNIEEVTKLLGDYYMMEGKVISGNHIGEKLGIRTANIDILEDYPTLKVGVYSVFVIIDKRKYLGVANFGYHPTVINAEKPLLEVHIMDFNEEIYGENIKIKLVSFLRSEQKFNSFEELVEQIKKDMETTKGKLSVL